MVSVAREQCQEDPVAPLCLEYFTPIEFERHHGLLGGRVLGVAGFGAPRPPFLAASCPFVDTGLPVLGAGCFYEVWFGAEPARYHSAGAIAAGSSADLTFGCLQLPETSGGGFEELSRAAYAGLFEFLDRNSSRSDDGHGHGHLLRIWNYFPGITADAGGMERYRRFSVGRHEAFEAAGRLVAQAPAACALGRGAGPLTIYFLAARGAGRPVENPRQVSAWRYPPQYGPRSPTFSRATLAQAGGMPLLFVSGTASIVGHRSMHIGDPRAQAGETIANVRAVLGEAERMGCVPQPGTLRLKAYLRHAADLPVVRAVVAQAFGDQVQPVYLQAEVCRPELQLEIECCQVPPVHMATPRIDAADR